MRKILTALSLLTFSACGSLHSQVAEKIHKGDSEQQVRAVFGKPEVEQTEGNSAAIGYRKSGEVCVIGFQDDKMDSYECVTETQPATTASKTGKALFSILGGMGQGLQSASQNRDTVHCTSYKDAGSKETLTTCR